LQGKRTLKNFKYRDAVLDISVEGYGANIVSCMIDGKESKPEIISTVTGNHDVKIILNNDQPVSKINKVPNYFSPAMPLITLEGNEMKWQKIDNAVAYEILKNGKVVEKITEEKFKINKDNYAEFQVIAVDANGVGSFASEPLVVAHKDHIKLYEAESFVEKSAAAYKGFSGSGFVETSKTINATIDFPIEIKESGWYAIDFKYANGNGPTNTENKCAIRSLKEKKEFLGTFVFPQRGVQEWSNWGFSNSVKVKLEKGKHILTLALDAVNENMNGVTNQAMLDYLRVTQL